MNGLAVWLRSRRVYGFAVAFYFMVAMLAYYPTAQKNHAAAQVSGQLQTLQAALPAASSNGAVAGEPQNFSIQRLGINLSVKTGTYDPYSRQWTLDTTHVFINTSGGARALIGSTTELQPKVTVFYGHEIPTVVGKTNDIVQGDILTIRTTNGYLFKYYFTRSETVDPAETAILAKMNDTPTVALITCSGFFSESRRIMYFAPLGEPQKVGSEQASR